MASEILEYNHPIVNTAADSEILESPLSTAVKTPLSEAVAEIRSLARRSDDYTLTLAIKVARLKVRLLAGEAGRGVNWSVWIAKEAKLSRPYIYFLANLGAAECPSRALKEAQVSWCEKQQKKTNTTDNLSKNHRMLIRLVHKLNNDEAKREYLELWKRYRNRID